MGKQIHIVEDDGDIRYIVNYILTEEGYQVVLSDSIEHFREKLTVQPPDLILLDIRLPDGNGLELCLELKKSNITAHIPIILMSAHATEQEVIRVSCADEFILKPFDLDELSRMIGKYLAH